MSIRTLVILCGTLRVPLLDHMETIVVTPDQYRACVHTMMSTCLDLYEHMIFVVGSADEFLFDHTVWGPLMSDRCRVDVRSTSTLLTSCATLRTFGKYVTHNLGGTMYIGDTRHLSGTAVYDVMDDRVRFVECRESGQCVRTGWKSILYGMLVVSVVLGISGRYNKV